MAFTVQRNPDPVSPERRAEMLVEPGFGKFTTDHLVRIDWTAADGWSEGAVLPYGPLSLDPATVVLHYGQEIFEGLKAYRQADGSIASFRPDANAERFQRSARRMGMPELPTELFLESLRALVEIDQDWVPTHDEESLYLRPFMYASEVGLGVRPSASATYLLIASPAGNYFPGGVAPVKVWLSTEYTRAAPGGTGEAKTGGNYAASLVAQAQAAQKGCDQVVWLDAVEHRWVEEMGTNNMYFVYGSGSSARIMTPALTGTLLPGVVRDTLLTMAKDLGYSVEEGRISVDEWQAETAAGGITEVFGCGTAAVITPIGEVRSAAGEWTVGDGRPGPISMQLRKALLDVQTGHAPDPHGWMHKLV
jgi:branched-chain amino acid aminotransferase